MSPEEPVLVPVERGALEAADGAGDAAVLGETTMELDKAVANTPPEIDVSGGFESEGTE